MAEFGSFGKGLTISREIQQTAEINRQKARQEAEQASADDARQMGEIIRDNMNTAREQAVEVATQMNVGLVQMAMLGEVDPDMVAQVKQGQLLALAQYASTVDQVRAAAGQNPGVDLNALAALPSGQDFVMAQMQALESQIVEGLAQAPIPKNKAEAEGLLAKAATVLGLESPAEMTPEQRAKVAATTIDTKFELFFGPSGDFVTVDTSTEQGKAQARQLVSKGYNKTSSQFQSDSPAALTGRDYTKFRADMTATMDMVSQLDRIRVIMDTDTPIATGLTREVAGFLTEAASQLAQASQVFGFTVEDDLLGPGGGLDLGGLNYDVIEDPALRDIVARSETLRFALGALAFMRARAMDPNDRLSGQEVQTQLTEIGRGKLTTLPAILDEIELETLSRFNNRLLIYQTDPSFASSNVLPDALKMRLDRAAAAYNPGRGQTVPEGETELATPKSTPAEVTKVVNLVESAADLTDPAKVAEFEKLDLEGQKRAIQRWQELGIIK